MQSCYSFYDPGRSSISAGAIEHVKMKLDKQSNTRIAFIEFKTNDAAKTALGMCGAQLGSSQIRVSPSKTPVRVNS